MSFPAVTLALSPEGNIIKGRKIVICPASDVFAMSKCLICTISYTSLSNSETAMSWESRKQNVLSASNYVKAKFSSCLVAKTDSLVAKRNVAPFKVIHIWLDKEVLWIRVTKVFSNESPPSGIKGQAGKKFSWPLVVHGRNTST